METTQRARVVAGPGTAALAGPSGSGTVAHELLTLEGTVARTTGNVAPVFRRL
ncbi:hypothetical protein GCM10023328_05520 [Modestobacter marinus]|uniref:Uncharacterized protein n=1 Tax=Modestobacter marinus TaxID=477641 RepID=A0A846LH84_9ACTN|nr:hypothetical protein [Modestobacter marinus]NIH67026.1 hypothetical protein [Modestobacter marinus]GGL51338.1 hypothetical protein GCM10011589_04440 [Modestobacter marinus]